MRVVQLGPYPPPHGGVQSNIVAIRDYLRRHGHSCAVLNITRNRKPEADEVFYPRNPAELVLHLATHRYDIIHLHVGGNMPSRVIALALACGSVPWAKAVFTFHSGGFPSSPEGQASERNSLYRFTLRRYAALIGVNRELTQHFERLGIAPNRIHMISPHAVNVNEMAAELTEPLKSFYARFDRVLISVCLLENEYQIPFQIAAMPRILERSPGTGLVIIGSGSMEAELRNLTASSVAREHILLCGDIPHSVTLRAIADASLLIRTTLYDGDAVSVREALHLGTPVVASDNGMRPAGVHLFPIGDEDGYIATVTACLREARRGQQHETDESNIAAVAALYQKLLT